MSQEKDQLDENQEGGGGGKPPGRDDPAYHEQRKREQGGSGDGGMKDFDRGGQQSGEGTGSKAGEYS